MAGKYDLSYFLALYAFATVVYSLSVVIITFEMSYKIANSSWVQLAFSGFLVVCICVFHSSLREVILVQLVLMSILFVFVATPFFIESLTDPKDQLQALCCGPVRLIRRVSEDVVIAEFLKNDFHYPEFEKYQQALRPIVSSPNCSDAYENAKRRALLFIRHLSLWNEIPQETEWYEVELNDIALSHVRTFPRAQWLRLARGDFSITGIAARLRARRQMTDAPFIAKIDAISEEIIRGGAEMGTVILIGVNENEPLTILDGNHRMVAAILASPSGLSKLRFICGLTPRMTQCCWYNTNIVTLLHYGKNVLTHAIRNPVSELASLLQEAG
jgi:hypothetical protein